MSADSKVSRRDFLKAGATGLTATRFVGSRDEELVYASVQRLD